MKKTIAAGIVALVASFLLAQGAIVMAQTATPTPTPTGTTGVTGTTGSENLPSGAPRTGFGM